MEYRFKGTPGNWRITQPERKHSYPGIESDTTSPEIDGAIVVFGLSSELFSGIQGNTPDERIANAHLISAAPDLLNACIALLMTNGAYIPEPVTNTLRIAVHKALNIK